MKKRGFTLVELLAVIAILAILVLISLPNVVGMFNNAKKSKIWRLRASILSDLFVHKWAFPNVFWTFLKRIL